MVQIVLMVLNKLNVSLQLSKDIVSVHLPNQTTLDGHTTKTHETDTKKARLFAVFVISDKQCQPATTRFFEHH